jgi:hypothetical protein
VDGSCYVVVAYLQCFSIDDFGKFLYVGLLRNVWTKYQLSSNKTQETFWEVCVQSIHMTSDEKNQKNVITYILRPKKTTCGSGFPTNPIFSCQPYYFFDVIDRATLFSPGGCGQYGGCGHNNY